MTAAVSERAGQEREEVGGGTIRRRVARILALPAVVVLVLLSLLAAARIQDYRGSEATSRSVKLALAVQDLVHELQTERGITAAVLGGNPSFTAELGPARARVDQQRALVAGLVAGGGGAQARVSGGLAGLDGLAAVRRSTDTGKAGRDPTFAFFTERIQALAGVDVGLDNTSDAQLRRGVATLQALADLSEATSQERAFLNGVFSAGGFARGEFVQFAAMRAERQAALGRFERFATPEQRDAADFAFDTGAARTTTAFEQVAINAADGRHIVVNPQSWWSGLTTVLDDLTQLQEHVGSQIQIRAHTLQSRSAMQIGGLVGVVVLCFAGSIYLAVLASRSITRPLAALAAEADSVAADRLPEAVRRLQSDEERGVPEPPAPVQVPDRATSEIRSVAHALDRLQAAAYGLATDQAVQRRDTIESMANLGRRNQNLIRRQLGFITTLEREEIDPSALANLFELDHLATRMRRNAASLLVLVGASTPRQWSSAVSVADMIRAAVSEVEEYRRVTLRRVDEGFMSGGAVGSIAHLLAELVENGLTFSPPDMDVEIQGRRLPEGYLIAVTDQGVGMSAEDLAQANARLRGEGDFIAAPTRFLGHFVVGKLAREVGVHVELLPSPVTGVTARVTVPQAMLSQPMAIEASPTATPPSGEIPANRARHSVDPPVSGRLPVLTAAPAGTVPATAASSSPIRPAGSPFDRPPSPDPDATPSTGLSITAITGAHPIQRATPPAAEPSGASAPSVASAPAASSAPERRTGPNSGSFPAATRSGGSFGASAFDHPPVFVPPTLPARSPEPAGSPTPSFSGGSSTGGSSTGGSSAGSASTGGNGNGVRVAPETGHAERTINGLRKRTPTGLSPADSPATGARRILDVDAAARRPVVSDSPAAVGARMTALRAGLARGKTAEGPGGGSSPGRDAVDKAVEESE